jgi:trimeric autotransporter adhesin
MKIRNTILVAILSALVCFGLLPGAKAQDTESALPNGNTADGQGALLSLTTGFYNSAFGFLSLLSNSTGNFNTGIGAGALLLTNGDPAVFDGIENTAVGAGALLTNSTGTDNNAVGAFALFNNTVGTFNNAVGHGALQANVDGIQNNAFGDAAMFVNTTGSFNTAIGDDALFDCTTGDSNVAVGDEAGTDLVDGSDNIYIGAGVQPGNPSESGFIRIGDNLSSGGIGILDGGPLANFVVIGNGLNTQGITIGTLIGFGSVSIGNGLQTTGGASTCNIGGIYNQAFGPADMAVRIGSDNKLGTVVSSRRFKHDIQPMDTGSEAILALKPVTFHYNSDTTNTPRVGFIAEDVAEVSPELVIPDKDGKPLSVRYEDINVMLLNEFLKEHKKVEEQQAAIAALNSTVAQQQKGMEVLTAQLKEQATQIQKVSAQVEVNKAAPQTVANK